MRKTLVIPEPVDLFELAAEANGVLADVPGHLIANLRLEVVDGFVVRRAAAGLEEAGDADDRAEGQAAAQEVLARRNVDKCEA